MQIVSRNGIRSLALSLIFPTQLIAIGNPVHLPQQPLPLDPLTHAEEELATRIAQDETRVQSELGRGRHRLIQVQFLATKAEAGQDQQALKTGRHAAVLFYRYDTDRGIHVDVNLDERSVGAITRLESMAVPLAREEVKEAFTLAIRKREVRAVLGTQSNQFVVAGDSAAKSPENRVEGLRVIAPLAADPCHRHRCIELHFRTHAGYVRATSVTVDLSTQRVSVHHPAR